MATEAEATAATPNINGGTDVTATLNDGMLTINGTGNMADDATNNV